METLDIHQVLGMLGKKSAQPWGVFSDLQTQGKINNFPTPLKIKVGGKRVFNKKRVLEWLNQDKEPIVNLSLAFLKGHYAPAHLQTKWAAKKARARINKPISTFVRVQEDHK